AVRDARHALVASGHALVAQWIARDVPSVEAGGSTPPGGTHDPAAFLAERLARKASNFRGSIPRRVSMPSAVECVWSPRIEYARDRPDIPPSCRCRTVP